MNEKIAIWGLVVIAAALAINIIIDYVRARRQRTRRIEMWEFDSQRNWYEVVVSRPHFPEKWEAFNLTADQGNTFQEILFYEEGGQTPIDYVFHYDGPGLGYIMSRIERSKNP